MNWLQKYYYFTTPTAALLTIIVIILGLRAGFRQLEELIVMDHRAAWLSPQMEEARNIVDGIKSVTVKHLNGQEGE